VDSDIPTLLENDFYPEATAPFVFDDTASEADRLTNFRFAFAATWQTNRDLS
jgi:hypothetical protein